MNDRNHQPQQAMDDALIARCRSELPYNHTAFEILVRRYEPLVFASCRHYFWNSADAQEVTQDIFLRVFHGLSRFRGEARFRTWLFRIVRNECATRMRSLKRRETRHAEYVAELDAAKSPAPDAAIPPPDQWTGRVGEVLDQLSPTDREVLVFRHIAGLSLDEVASALDIKLSAAKMRLYRAEERFRTLYQSV